MTNVKRPRPLKDLEGRQIPTSIAFLRDCDRDHAEAGGEFEYEVRRIFDQHEIASALGSGTRHASTQYERDFFDEITKYAAERTGQWRPNERDFYRTVRRWHRRQKTRAAERRSNGSGPA